MTRSSQPSLATAANRSGLDSQRRGSTETGVIYDTLESTRDSHWPFDYGFFKPSRGTGYQPTGSRRGRLTRVHLPLRTQRGGNTRSTPLGTWKTCEIGEFSGARARFGTLYGVRRWKLDCGALCDRAPVIEGSIGAQRRSFIVSVGAEVRLCDARRHICNSIEPTFGFGGCGILAGGSGWPDWVDCRRLKRRSIANVWADECRQTAAAGGIGDVSGGDCGTVFRLLAALAGAQETAPSNPRSPSTSGRSRGIYPGFREPSEVPGLSPRGIYAATTRARTAMTPVMM